MSYPPYILKQRKKLNNTCKSRHDEGQYVDTKKFILPQKIYAIKRSNSLDVPAGEAYTLYVATASQLGILANNIVFLDNELRPIQIVHKNYNTPPPPVTNAFHKHRTQEIGLESGNIANILFKPEVPLQLSTSSILDSVHRECIKANSKRSHSVPHTYNLTSTSAIDTPCSAQSSNSSINNETLFIPLRSGSSVPHRSGSEILCPNGVKMKCPHCDKKPNLEILLEPSSCSHSSKRLNKQRAHFSSDLDISQVTVSSTTTLDTDMDCSRELCALSPTWSPYAGLEGKKMPVTIVSHVDTTLPKTTSIISSFTSRLGPADTDEDSRTSNESSANQLYSTYQTCCKHQTTSCHGTPSEPSEDTIDFTCRPRKYSTYKCSAHSQDDSKTGLRSYGNNLLTRFKSCYKKIGKPKHSHTDFNPSSCKTTRKLIKLPKKPSSATCSSSSTYIVSRLSRLRSAQGCCSESPSNSSSSTSTSSSSSGYSVILANQMYSSSSSSYSESDTTSSTQSDSTTSDRPIRLCRVSYNDRCKPHYSRQHCKPNKSSCSRYHSTYRFA